jgi:predicted amidophosphoribosyltransferase
MATNGKLIDYYPVGSSVATVHSTYIRGNEIDAIYVAWLYQSLKPFAWSIRQLKALAPALHSSSAAAKLADLIWTPILDDILRWAWTMQRPTAVIPVPSTTGLSELLGQRLAFLLAIKDTPMCKYQALLERRWRDVQVKQLANWRSRERFSFDAFRLHAGGLRGFDSAIIVDDVIASGSSLRACASTLRAEGMHHIVAAAACADLARWISCGCPLRLESTH